MPEQKKVPELLATRAAILWEQSQRHSSEIEAARETLYKNLTEFLRGNIETIFLAEFNRHIEDAILRGETELRLNMGYLPESPSSGVRTLFRHLLAQELRQYLVDQGYKLETNDDGRDTQFIVSGWKK